MMTAVSLEREVLEWLGWPATLEAVDRCDLCDAPVYDGDGHVVDEVPCPQEGGRLSITICAACLGCPDA